MRAAAHWALATPRRRWGLLALWAAATIGWAIWSRAWASGAYWRLFVMNGALVLPAACVIWVITHPKQR